MPPPTIAMRKGGSCPSFSLEDEDGSAFCEDMMFSLLMIFVYVLKLLKTPNQFQRLVKDRFERGLSFSVGNRLAKGLNEST